MPPVKFRLESLLRIRRLAEDEAKRTVAERLRQIQSAEQQIAARDDQLLEAGRTMRSLVLAGRIVPQEAARQRGYMGIVQAQRFEVTAQLQALWQKLVEDRAVLAEAGKRRKILDKLKERQQRQRIREQNAAERRAEDEIGVLTFVREHQETGDRLQATAAKDRDEQM
jgi:flagellar FliJ protein